MIILVGLKKQSLQNKLHFGPIEIADSDRVFILHPQSKTESEYPILNSVSIDIEIQSSGPQIDTKT